MDKIADELKSYRILDSDDEEFFDRITKVSAKITGCDISLIVFLDTNRQWFKSTTGVEIKETPLEFSICKELIGTDLEILVIPDLSKDDYFKNHPAYSNFGIKFYAGAPIYSDNHILLGTVCVMDTKPKQLEDFHIDFLKNQAEQVKQMLELRRKNFQIEKEKRALEVWRSFTERSAILGGAGGFIINKEKEKLHWWPTNNVLFGLIEGVEISYKHLINQENSTDFEEGFQAFLSKVFSLIFVERSTSGEFLFHLKSPTKVFKVTFREEDELVLFFINDYTSQYAFQQEISKQNQLIQKIEKVSNVGAWELDLSTNKVSLTSNLLNLLQIEQGLSISFTDLRPKFSQISWEFFTRDISSSLKSRTSFSNIYQLVTEVQEEKWLKVYGEPDFVNGEVVRFTGSGHDVSEDIRLLSILEDKIRVIQEKNDYLDSLVNNQSFFIFKTDLAGNITFYNSFYKERFVPDDITLIGTQALDIIVEQDREICLEAVNKAIANPGKTFKVKFQSKNKHGEIQVGIWDFSYQLRDGDRSSEILCLGCDVTELEEKNARIQKLSHFSGFLNNKLIEFSNITSHNIRSQVSNLKGLMVLMTITEDEDEKAKYLELMNDTVENLDKLLHKIIETLSINNGENQLKEEILLNAFVHSIISNVFPSLMTDEASFVVDCDEELTAYINKTYLQSVLEKLISNSIEYKSPDRKLSMKIVIRENNVTNKLEFSVEDNGQGMDIDPDSSKLFRLYQTNHEISGSKGFGLFFVKNIIEFMGGNIAIQSRKNVGTRIILELPYEY